jgi:hypothetical protein
MAANDGITASGDLCMQEVFGGATIKSSNLLNCTANDIALSGVSDFSPASCEEGTSFTLTATFKVNVTANARYDAGFFFRTDGGASARGDGTVGQPVTGTCSLSQLVVPSANTSILDLDGDSCGDMNAGANQLVTLVIPNVSCTGVTDPNDSTKKILKLPNCTSWHSNQGTACNIANLGANPPDGSGAKPDTKSKCVCDDNFTVPVTVTKPSGSVTKTATDALVSFSTTVTNDGTVSVIVDSLVDKSAGESDLDLFTATGSDCKGLTEAQRTLGVNGTLTCTWSHLYNNPGTGGDRSDAVTAVLRNPQNGTTTEKTSNTVKINVNLSVQ